MNRSQSLNFRASLFYEALIPITKRFNRLPRSFEMYRYGTSARGAPFDENHELLTQSATLLSHKLNEHRKTPNQTTKKRKSCDTHKETYNNFFTSFAIPLCPYIQ